MTRRRDLANLKQKDKYKRHRNCTCEECTYLDLWLDNEIEKLAADCD